MIAHDPSLVILSITIAILGTFTARVMMSNIEMLERGERRVRLLMATIALGGALWAMNFVGLLALDAPVNFAYNPIPLGVSAALAFIGAGAPLFMLGMRGGEAGSRLLLASVIFGTALAVMNYLGVAAIAGAGLKVEWFLTAVSAAASLQVGYYALWYLFKRRGVLMTLGGAVGIGLCLAATHYLAVASTEALGQALFSAPPSTTGISERYLAWSATIMMYLICSICLCVFAIAQFREDIE